MRKEKSREKFNIILILTLLVCLILSMGKTYQKDQEIDELRDTVRVQQSIIVEYQYE